MHLKSIHFSTGDLYNGEGLCYTSYAQRKKLKQSETWVLGLVLDLHLKKELQNTAHVGISRPSRQSRPWPRNAWDLL